MATAVSCSGSENNLTDCSFFTIPDIQEYFYYHYNYFYFYFYLDVASVVCQGNSSVGPECVPGEVRLVNGSRGEEGRVELCYNRVWRTICDQDWSQEEAVVVCSQLGLPTLGWKYHSLYSVLAWISFDVLCTGAQPFTDAYFGEGSAPVLGYTTCTGRERSLEDCAVYEQQTDCHHGRDAGVKCRGMTATQAYHYEKAVCQVNSIYTPYRKQCKEAETMY